MSADEWLDLPWHLQRMLLDGMEEDESVPLSFESSGPSEPEAGPVVTGLPEGAQVRQADPDAVINIGAMLGDLDAARRSRGR